MSKEPENKFKSFLAAKKDAAGAQDNSEPESGFVAGSASRGRPSGKRSDPAFEQVTAYIRRSTHNAVKIALLEEGQRRQFSELVEQLVSDWVERNK
jgi:hypothetical protein